MWQEENSKNLDAKHKAKRNSGHVGHGQTVMEN